MSISSRIEPDIDFYEKSSTFGRRPAPASNISSDSGSSTTTNPEYQSVQANIPAKSGVTPMPAWVDISLAVMTLGLSVPAFHAVKGVSDKRAARKALKQQQAANAGKSNSYLVPSSVVRSATTATSDMKDTKITELDSSPLEPPPYSPGGRSQRSAQDIKAQQIAELP